MVHFPLSTLWAFAPRLKAATMKCGYTWISLTITAAMNREKNTNCGFSSKKGLLLANPAKKGARQVRNATVRCHPKCRRPFATVTIVRTRNAAPMSTIEGTHNAVHQALRSVTGHSFFFFCSVLFPPFHVTRCIHVTWHVALHLLNVSKRKGFFTMGRGDKQTITGSTACSNLHFWMGGLEVEPQLEDPDPFLGGFPRAQLENELPVDFPAVTAVTFYPFSRGPDVSLEACLEACQQVVQLVDSCSRRALSVDSWCLIVCVTLTAISGLRLVMDRIFVENRSWTTHMWDLGLGTARHSIRPRLPGKCFTV